MNAVIYARYSSDNQREESIEGQIRECTAYAERNGITVVRHYIDRALSAKTDNRPDFQQMIRDSNKKLFEIDGVELEFEDDAVEAIAEKSLARKTGARGLRAIMEDTMMDLMYQIPSDESIVKCTITKETVEDKKAKIEYHNA